MTVPNTLSQPLFEQAVERLVHNDPDLALIVARQGPPPLWTRQPGFAALVRILLEQQVSLASAKAVYDRLLAATSLLTPASLLLLDDETMRAIGFSKQKTAYARGIAQAIVDRRFDLDRLAMLSDEDAYAELTQLRGIGPWTAHVYLLMALRRTDVWPVGDLALVIAVQEIKDLPQRPSAEKMTTTAAPWRPWRSVAARLLWHHYLTTR